MSIVAVWAVAALAGSISTACGGRDPASSPVGVWQVADPEGWARWVLPRLRKAEYGEPIPPKMRIGTDVLPRDPRENSDEDVLADLVRIGRALLIEFRDDGAFGHNFETWMPGTWTANGSRIQTSQPWPAATPNSPPTSEPRIVGRPPHRTEFHFDGPDLIWEHDRREPDQVRMRRSRHTFAPPEAVEARTRGDAPR